MSDYKRYGFTGHIEVDIDEVRDFLEERDDRELPDDYEPTEAEWHDAAWEMLKNCSATENIELFEED